MTRHDVWIGLATVSVYVLLLCIGAFFERTRLGQRIAQALGLNDYEDFDDSNR